MRCWDKEANMHANKHRGYVMANASLFVKVKSKSAGRLEGSLKIACDCETAKISGEQNMLDDIRPVSAIKAS